MPTTMKLIAKNVLGSNTATVTFSSIPQENVRFADTILGFMLGTVMASMFSFLLGSSFGSRVKDEKK